MGTHVLDFKTEKNASYNFKPLNAYNGLSPEKRRDISGDHITIGNPKMSIGEFTSS